MSETADPMALSKEKLKIKKWTMTYTGNFTNVLQNEILKKPIGYISLSIYTNVNF